MAHNAESTHRRLTNFADAAIYIYGGKLPPSDSKNQKNDPSTPCLVTHGQRFSEAFREKWTACFPSVDDSCDSDFENLCPLAVEMQSKEILKKSMQHGKVCPLVLIWLHLRIFLDGTAADATRHAEVASWRSHAKMDC